MYIKIIAIRIFAIFKTWRKLYGLGNDKLIV